MEKPREKEGSNEFEYTIEDGLLLKERIRLSFQNLGSSQSVNKGIFCIYTISALEMPPLALFDLPGDVLENLKS